MNDVQKFILNRAMQKVASEGYQPYLDVDNSADYMKYPGRTVRVKNAHGGYDYITNPNKVNKDGVQTLMAPHIMRTNAQGDYINADGTINGFLNNAMKHFRDTMHEQAHQNQQQIPTNNMNYDENEAYGFSPELVPHQPATSNIDAVRNLLGIQNNPNPYSQRRPLQGPASALSNSMNVRNPAPQQPQTQLPAQGSRDLK